MGERVNSLLGLIQNFLEPDEKLAAPPAKVLVQRQYFSSQSGSTSRLLVQRAPTPYWKERGWQQRGSDFAGSFQSRYGTWPGYITVSPSGRIEVFISNPPSVLEKHPHWPCFRARENGWYFIHATKPVPDVSAGILSTERTLNEAFQL
jgi:hypothetical protein